MILLFLKLNNNNSICNGIRLKNIIRMSSSVTFYYNDIYKQPLPLGHRFPMEKYRIVRENLQKRLIGNNNVKFCVSPLGNTNADININTNTNTNNIKNKQQGKN